MSFSRVLRSGDEREIFHLRGHGKALVLPTLSLMLIAVITGAAVAVLPTGWGPWGRWALVAVVSVSVLVWCVEPFLRWLTTTYTITDRRIITRGGILRKSGHDLPLTRISDVTYHQSLIDRMLGCGSLVFTTAVEEPLTLHDIPSVEEVYLTVTELLFGMGIAATKRATS